MPTVEDGTLHNLKGKCLRIDLADRIVTGEVILEWIDSVRLDVIDVTSPDCGSMLISKPFDYEVVE